MFPFIYRRQTVQAQPGPRRGHTQRGGSSRGKAVLPSKMEKFGFGRTASWLAGGGRGSGWPARRVGRRAEGWMGLEAGRRVLLNLGFKGAVELPLLIVHLTQDHVVLQEEFVSHTKSRKAKQEREAARGVLVGSRIQPGSVVWHVRKGVLVNLLLELPRGIARVPQQASSVTLGRALQPRVAGPQPPTLRSVVEGEKG